MYVASTGSKMGVWRTKAERQQHKDREDAESDPSGNGVGGDVSAADADEFAAVKARHPVQHGEGNEPQQGQAHRVAERRIDPVQIVDDPKSPAASAPSSPRYRPIAAQRRAQSGSRRGSLGCARRGPSRAAAPETRVPARNRAKPKAKPKAASVSTARGIRAMPPLRNWPLSSCTSAVTTKGNMKRVSWA